MRRTLEQELFWDEPDEGPPHRPETNSQTRAYDLNSHWLLLRKKSSNRERPPRPLKSYVFTRGPAL
jgi:hypothetical protein